MAHNGKLVMDMGYYCITDHCSLGRRSFDSHLRNENLLHEWPSASCHGKTVVTIVRLLAFA